jgi:hypothetical protein
MSDVIIYMNGEPLGGIQSWKEDYFVSNELPHVTIRIKRIIFDGFSALGCILSGENAEFEIVVGEHRTGYKALRLMSGSREFTSNEDIDTEELVLSTVHKDVELDKLKSCLTSLMNAKKSVDDR